MCPGAFVFWSRKIRTRLRQIAERVYPVFSKDPQTGKNLHIDFGISGYAGSVHPKAPDTFLKFLRIPEAVCNAEEDPVLSQKAMLLF